MEVTQKKYISEENFSVDVLKFSCEKTSLKSLLIIPPTGGTNYIDRSYAKKFCKAGYDVYILETWDGQLEKDVNFSVHQRFYARAQLAIQTTLDQIQTPFIGLLGTSVGAMHSAVASVQQPRIDAIFSIVGGIPISDIIFNSDQQAMVDLKKSRQNKFGIKSDFEYKAQLDKAFYLEPKSLGDSHKQKQFFVVVAENDTTVPTANQFQLVEFWKPKTVLKINSGHFWGIVKTWLFHSGEVVNFFESASRTN